MHLHLLCKIIKIHSIHLLLLIKPIESVSIKSLSPSLLTTATFIQLPNIFLSNTQTLKQSSDLCSWTLTSITQNGIFTSSYHWPLVWRGRTRSVPYGAAVQENTSLGRPSNATSHTIIPPLQRNSLAIRPIPSPSSHHPGPQRFTTLSARQSQYRPPRRGQSIHTLYAPRALGHDTVLCYTIERGQNACQTAETWRHEAFCRHLDKSTPGAHSKARQSRRSSVQATFLGLGESGHPKDSPNVRSGW